MPDRARLDAAMAELSAAINAFIADAEKPVDPPPPPAEPYARFTNFPPFRVQEATLQVETNAPGLKWVLYRDNPPQHTWYGDPQPVPASGVVTVRAQHDGDKVKLFTDGFGINVNSLPFKFDAPAGAVTPPTGSAALAKVNTFLDGLTGGYNVEREMCYEFDQGAWNYLHQQVPADSVRIFLPWRPEDGIFAANEGRAWQLPRRETVQRFVASMKMARQAGFKRVFADCSDVCQDGSFSEDGIRLLRQCCEMVAEEVKAQNVGADYLCLGPVNEWATSQDNVHRCQDIFLAAMRRILPQHIFCYGPDYWKYWGKLIENDSYKPPKDELSICDVHAYKEMDANGWRWLAGELNKWQQRTKRRVVYGEAGPGNLMQHEQDYGVYPHNIRTMMPIMRPFVPMTWSVNKGGHWKLNWHWAEFVNKQPYNNGGHAPDIADALKDALGLR